MKRRNKSGFTLVEIMIVVAIIALLAGVAYPSYIKYWRNSRVAKVASDFRTFGGGFNLYLSENGLYPVDTHLVLPPGMDEYVNLSSWQEEALGGNYNWEGPVFGEGGGYPYAGISISGSTEPESTFVMLDELIDDGNLAKGCFRKTPNGRYTYIIAE